MIGDDAVDPVADLLGRAAELAAAGEPGEAGALAARAAAMLDRDDTARADTFGLAASLLDRAARHLEAADAWAEVAAAAAGDATRARALTAEGESARRAGQWARATDAHTWALGLAEDAFGETVETAAIAQNLATVFKYTGRFDDAERLHRRALTIAEAARDQHLIATICHNLGGLAHARGIHEAGIPWARRSVAVREQLDDPVRLAADKGALASLLIDRGDLDEAAALLLDARRTFVAHRGDDDHEVAVVDGNLATIALRTGDLDAAERHARRALEGKERRLGPTHPELAVTLTTLGTICRRRGDAEAAVSLHQRARDLLAPAVESDHPLLRTIEENLAVAQAAARPA